MYDCCYVGLLLCWTIAMFDCFYVGLFLCRTVI